MENIGNKQYFSVFMESEFNEVFDVATYLYDFFLSILC